jgi:hypothetical protein
LSGCYLEGTASRHGLVLGFGGLGESHVSHAVSRLWRAIAEASRQTPRRRSAGGRRQSGHVD